MLPDLVQASLHILVKQVQSASRVLCDAGALKKLVGLLEGNLSQKNATLESLAAVFKNNPEVISKFVGTARANRENQCKSNKTTTAGSGKHFLARKTRFTQPIHS
ncbi:unnamed protein product [Dovyalis caffra]|uniref:Uncharacterized protein n=1 Tax=Dovyalis caffra TaxID=77055 RepID=A0AAV1RAJ7_9ROSI|nr:unnamed protein product [Dovyalis caffra]